jgi:hypothetical protein
MQKHFLNVCLNCDKKISLIFNWLLISGLYMYLYGLCITKETVQMYLIEFKETYKNYDDFSFFLWEHLTWKSSYSFEIHYRPYFYESETLA